jgi:DNA-binding transcriptional MerR regulator
MKINNYYKISEAAEVLGVCSGTLRNWDRDGVLKPGRTPAGHRVYTRGQLLEFLKKVRESSCSTASGAL